MATLTAKAAGGEWKVAGTWEPEQVPTAADDCVLNAASGTVSVKGAVAKCRSLNCEGFTKTLHLEESVEIGTTTSNGGKCLILSSGMTLTKLFFRVLILKSTSGSVEKITTNGIKVGEIHAESGKYEQTDKLECDSTVEPLIRLTGSTEWKTGNHELVAWRIQLEGTS